MSIGGKSEGVIGAVKCEFDVGQFTIEPVLTPTIKTSRLARNINAVKAQMLDNAKNQFTVWE